METTIEAAEKALDQLSNPERWIELRGGAVLASYVAWLCSVAADKQATNEDDRAYYWLQHWRWLTAEHCTEASRLLDRMVDHLWRSTHHDGRA